MSMYYLNNKEQRILRDALRKSNESIDEGFRAQNNEITEEAAQRIRDLEEALKRLIWLRNNDLHATTPVASEAEWDEAWETASELVYGHMGAEMSELLKIIK